MMDFTRSCCAATSESESEVWVVDEFFFATIAVSKLNPEISVVA